MKIAVVGLGAVGAQVLWSLSSKAGVEVHGFEGGYVGHPQAGAGGEGRLYRNLELTTMGYMPLIKRSDELWDCLENDSGRRLRRRGGALLFGQADDAQILHALASAQDWNLPHEVYGAEELGRLFPHFSLSENEIGVWDSGAGVIAPEIAVRAAVGQAVAHGAVVHEFAPVEHLDERAGFVDVRLESGEELTFDHVVVACGGWTTQLVPELREWIVTRRLTSAWFAGRTERGLRGLPPFMHVAPAYCYGVPDEDERLVKLGLGFNDHMPAGDPDSVPRHLDHRQVREEVEKFAWILRDLIPSLEPNPVRLGTYIESYTRSMHEFMGTAPGHTRVTVLSGFSGHGFKMSPALGEIGAELAVAGESRFDLRFLDEATPVFDITDVEAGTTTFNRVVASGRRPR